MRQPWRTFFLMLLLCSIKIKQEQLDALVDRKESLKQELKKTQDDLQTSKENHRCVPDVLTWRSISQGFAHC